MPHKRLLFLRILLDSICSFIALALAMLLRFDLKTPVEYWSVFPVHALMFTVVVIFFGLLLNNYSGIQEYAGSRDFINAMFSVFSSCVFLLMLKYTDVIEFSGSIIVMYSLILFCMVLFTRFFKKAFTQISVSIQRMVNRNIRNVLVCSDDSPIYTIRHLQKSRNADIKIVGIITGAPNLWKTDILGVKVIGGYELFEKTVIKKRVNEVVYVLNPENDRIRELHAFCKQRRILFQIFQRQNRVAALGMPQKSIIRDVDIEDLLGRNEIHLEKSWIDGFIADKTVFVTGGAGSIGSEICRQCLYFGCKRLIIFDIHENGLFYIENELLNGFDASRIVTCLGTVRDNKRLNSLFEEYRPDIVFHAAAHKHVPLMEINPCEAIKNNVFGTLNVINQCNISGVKKLIVISSDKAVNPANIMGATKRVCEMLVQAIGRDSNTEMAAVRFGNVLGSNGSVIPLFKAQIASGGPVTVTHKDVERYFMTISEAVQLVLQAGALASRGEIFVFDMGKLIKIYDLARELIHLSGLQPDRDIEIKITGLRPGEKLFEELRLDKENVARTLHEKIFACKPINLDRHELMAQIETLMEIIDKEDGNGISNMLFRIVPSMYRESARYEKPEIKQIPSGAHGDDELACTSSGIHKIPTT